MKQPCVYMLASGRNGTLYIGVTSDLAKRVWEHREHLVEGFTKRHGVHLLVWYEVHATIEKSNPGWSDLYEDLFGDPGSRLSLG